VRWLESLATEAPSLDAYLREIARFPELTGPEERQLSERVQHRDGDAVAQLAASQLGLVLGYAQKYRHLGVSLVDLVHDGNLALVDAARRFRPERHGRFATYALWWVRQAILHRLSQVQSATPALDADARAAYLSPALRAIVEHAIETSPTGESRRDAAHPDERRRLHEAWRRSSEWDRPDDEVLDLDDIGSLLIDEGEEAVRSALASDLNSSLLELHPQERRTLELRLGLIDGEPRSVDQIGDRLRISPARVERLSARAVRKLRRHRSVRSSLN
jgi:RNA polymerase primary sigma factor